MELTDAINHLEESLADPTHKWGCEECKEEHIQLLVWLESYKNISESYPEVRKKIDRLEKENMRLLESALRLGKRCETLEEEVKRLQDVSNSEDYKHLKDDYADLDNRLRTANTENEELKRMLKKSLEALDAMAENIRDECGEAACGLCEYDSPLNEYGEMIYECEGVNGKTDCLKWRHHDEAMELLGGTENAEN